MADGAHFLHAGAVDLLDLSHQQIDRHRFLQHDGELVDRHASSPFEDVDTHDVALDRADARRHEPESTRPVRQPDPYQDMNGAGTHEMIVRAEMTATLRRSEETSLMARSLRAGIPGARSIALRLDGSLSAGRDTRRAADRSPTGWLALCEPGYPARGRSLAVHASATFLSLGLCAAASRSPSTPPLRSYAWGNGWEYSAARSIRCMSRTSWWPPRPER